MSIFSEVKERVSMRDAIDYLGLKVAKRTSETQLRFKCPRCETKDTDPLSIDTAGDKFTCFAKSPHARGTDSIALVAHCRGISQTDAAKELQEHFLRNSTKPEPAKAKAEGRGESANVFSPLEFHQWEHPVMDMLNLSPAVLQAIGGGIGREDELKDRICIPLRKPDGSLIGYQGIATRSDMAPLVMFWSENIEERVKPVRHEPEEMRKILRLPS